MPGKNVVILNGAGPCDKDLSPILNVLSQVLHVDGAQIETFPLCEAKMAHCVGCFDCWVKTPGTCVEADAGCEIAKAIVRSDVTVLFTPVTFGGYSPELKKMVDRLGQLASPDFQLRHGEVHHQPRYSHLPRLLIVGVQGQPSSHEAHIFRTLAGRNAIGLHSPSYAAEVVSVKDDADALRVRFESLLTRSDPLPFGDASASLLSAPVASGEPLGARRALLIVGSPKIDEPSTSGILGRCLAILLEERGWETESLTLQTSLDSPEGERELLAAVERAGLIVLAFPLYADALPYLATKALTLISTHRASGEPTGKRLVGIVNSGFPEAHQNSAALAICREFAAQSGLVWAGALSLGGGGVIGGQTLTGTKHSGPPVRDVIAALEMTGAALAEGLPVPANAAAMVARKRIPFAFWRGMHAWMGGNAFEKSAAKNGIGKKELRARPYASKAGDARAPIEPAAPPLP